MAAPAIALAVKAAIAAATDKRTWKAAGILIAAILTPVILAIVMMMNVLASTADVDEATLRRLRGKCVSDVKKSVGTVTFEDVARFQKGE